MEYKSPGVRLIKNIDGKTQFLHIKYSNDGKTFTENNGEELGAWIGTLVDFNEADSTVFSDYTWKKFAEDVDKELDDIRQTIHNQYTSIVKECERIILSAHDIYVDKGSYDEYKKALEAELSVLSTQISIKVKETVEYIDKVNDGLQSKYNNVVKYFTFNIDGVTIGAENNPNKVVIDNDEISILVNNVVVQKFDSHGKALIPELNVTRQIDMFGYQITEDDAGNVNCEYVGA